MRRSAIEHVESKQIRKDITDFRTGDTVRVHWKVKEGDKERVQPFEGVVIRKTRGQNRATFTVRKVSYGVGVERIFPLHSPRYEKIEVITHGNVHRNRLFFLRNLRGKASRLQHQEESVTEAPTHSTERASASSQEAAPSAEQAAEGDAPKQAAPESTGGEKTGAKAKKSKSKPAAGARE
jgi:large subunit ribosomal protein L19